MKTVAMLFLLFFAVARPARPQPAWQRKDAGVIPTATINGITASGFLVVGSVSGGSPNSVVRSTDSGASWSTGTPLPPLKLKSISPSFLYGVRGDSIMTTPNQGLSAWTVLRPALNMTLADVHYITSSPGQAWAVGDTNYAARTFDNWTNFQILPFLVVDSVLMGSVQFFDNNFGFAAGRSAKIGSNAAIILRTTDGGQTWQERGLPGTCPSTPLLAVDFISPLVGWAAQTCGTTAYFYKTTDGGSTWSLQDTKLSFRAFAIDAVNASYVWIAGQLNVSGAIAKTANGGLNWSFENLPQLPQPPGRLLSIAMQDTAHGFACGEAATLLVYAPITTDVAGDRQNRPKSFELSQNYPNPFNGETRILFTLQKSQPVTLSIYNILGQSVRKLVDGMRPAGKNEASWDGRDERGLAVPSGIYLYKLSTPKEKQIRKMVLLK